MTYYQFTLEPYGNGRNTRFTCPGCHRKRQFTRYIDAETGQHLHETAGVCNRETKCGYHYTPKQYFADNPHLQQARRRPPAGTAPGRGHTAKGHATRLGSKAPVSRAVQPASCIPVEKFRESRRHYSANNFALFLRGRFGKEKAEMLISRYHIGTSRKWAGATVFWQIDGAGKVRTGKIMLYDRESGRRVKKPFAHLTWVHKALGLEGYNLVQCLFGEHLLPLFPGKPVAVVESEKTAVICSLLLPRYVWLATGGLSFLSEERLQVLRGRNVTLFPDLGGYALWSKRAREMQGTIRCTVSDVLERVASDAQRKESLDLADFLLPPSVES